MTINFEEGMDHFVTFVIFVPLSVYYKSSGYCSFKLMFLANMRVLHELNDKLRIIVQNVGI